MKTVFRSHINPVIIGFVATKVKMDPCVEILHLNQTSIVFFKKTDFYEKH